MEIAPGFSAEAWRRLELDADSHPDWGTAVDVLRDRLWKRYVEPVDALVAAEPDDPTKRTIGFTVLAIDCLLVEAYASFRLGIVDSSGQSRRLYRALLSERPRFSAYFDDAKASRFYTAFRCGILHQAEVPPSCRIWSIGPLWSERDGITYVNRSAFHEVLKAELAEYLEELRLGHADLRANFRRKMNAIATS